MAVHSSAREQDPYDQRVERAREDQPASVVRHEERLVVNTEEHVVGRARLRKYVVEEPARQNVTLGIGEPDMVRTPITADERQAFLDGRQLTTGEDEMILYRTEPVVQTVRVPYQRVRLVAKRTEHTEVIDESIRKERVDIQSDDRP